MSQPSLTEQYEPWIKKIVRRMWNKFQRYYEYEELLGIAYIASIEAEKTYDPEKGKFSAHVKPRIEGAIIRSTSNITNKEHKRLLEVYAFIDRYTEKYGNVPGYSIILRELKMNEKEFFGLLDATTKIKKIPLDKVPEDSVSYELDLDTQLEYTKVQLIIDQLSEKHKRAVYKFLDNPNCSEESIKQTLDVIRDKLQVKENV